MKYKVTKKFGKFKVGDIVDDSDNYIRRKIQEGGCLEAIKESKAMKEPAEKKVLHGAPENKGGNK